MKKMIAILLFAFLSFSVWAETTNETTISGDVVIPSIRGDYSVTSTGDAAFTYKVTFNANGGEGMMADQSFVSGTEQALSANTFTRDGYGFAGWATSADGVIAYADEYVVNNLTTEPNGVVTLYAIWFERSYLIVDLKTGAHSYTNSEPAGGWTDEYKTEKLVLVKIPKNEYSSLETFYMSIFDFTYAQAYNVSYDYDTDKTCSCDVANCTHPIVIQGYDFFDFPYDHHNKIMIFNLLDEFDFSFSFPSTSQWSNVCSYDLCDSIEQSKAEDGLPTVGCKKPNRFGLYDTNCEYGEILSDSIHYEGDPNYYGYIYLGKAHGEILGECACYECVQYYIDDDLYPRIRLIMELEFVLSFDANGGEGEMSPITIQNGTKGNVLPEVSFKRSGHSFVGWATSPSGKAVYEDNAEIKPYCSMTLYAIWTANSYNVKFNSNGGVGEMSNQSFTYGIPKNLSKNSFSKEGYTFIGWSLTPSGDVEFVDCDRVINLSSEPNACVNLYAIWRENDRTVVFDSCGGEGVMEDFKTTFEFDVKLPSCQFYKKDGVFLGWSMLPYGDIIYTDRDIINIPADIKGLTLYAVWAEKRYLIVDLKTGAHSYTNSEPVGGWTDEYKTEKLVFARIPVSKYLSSQITNSFYMSVFELTRAQVSTNTYNWGGNCSCDYDEICTHPFGADDIEDIGEFSQYDYHYPGVIYLDNNWFDNEVFDFSIPTEEQWVYAYSYNDMTEEYGWFPSNSGGDPHNVGLKKPNNFGLYDMAGNVAEITREGYGPIGGEGATFSWYGGSFDFSDFMSSTHERYFHEDYYGEVGVRLVWEPDSEDVLDVTFDANGGEGVMADQSFLLGIEQSLSANAFTRDGYGFAGWATSADGPVAYTDTQSVHFYAPMTLYAVWELNRLFEVGEDGDYIVSGYTNVYDGVGHGISISVDDSIDAQITYSLDGKEFVSEMPILTNVCEQTVWYKLEAEGYLPMTNSAQVVINPRPVTLTSATKSWTYDGVAHSAESVQADGFIEGQGASYSDFASILNVGFCENIFKYTLNAGTLASNYDIDVVNGKLSITKVSIVDPDNPGEFNDDIVDIEISVPEEAADASGDHMYDGTAKTLDVTVRAKVGTSELTLVEGTDYDCTYYDNINARSASNNPRVTITAKGNYSGSDTFEFDINPRPVMLTSGNKSFVYDANAHSFEDVTISGNGFVGNEGVAYSSFATITNVGEINNTFSYAFTDGTIAANYAITQSFGKLIVKAVGLDTMFDIEDDFATDGSSYYDTTFEYDGQEHTINTNLLYAIGEGSDIDLSFSFAMEEKGEYQTTPFTFVDAGVYTIWYKISAANYDDFIHQATVRITKRPLSKDMVVMEGTSFEWTGSPVVPSFYLEDFVNGIDIIENADWNYSLSNNINHGKNALITITASEGGNYSGTITQYFNIIPKIPTLEGTIGWRYNLGTGTFFAQLNLLCTDGNPDAVEDVWFYFEDRVTSSRKVQLWNTRAGQPIQDTMTVRGSTFRWQVVPSAAEAIRGSELNTPFTAGVQDINSTSPSVPVSERMFELYAQENGKVMDKAQIEKLICYLAWSSSGKTNFMQIGAADVTSGLVDHYADAPRPVELVNNSLAFGVSLDAVRDYGVKFKEIAIGADGVVDIQMATFGGQEEGVPGPNASLILLGKDNLEDEFEDLGTVNVDSQGGFSFDNDDTPTGFYKLKLKYAPILE